MSLAFTPVEEMFQGFEKQITDSVLSLLGIAKKEIVELNNEELKANILDSCKQCVARTQLFQQMHKGARRPYVTHSTELGFALRDIDSALLALEDVLGAAKGEVSDPELAEQLTNEIHAGRVTASDTIAVFKKWLFTDESAYLFASDRSLDAPEPTTPDQAKTDLMKCPKWLLQQLVMARKAHFETEARWRSVHEEVDQLKVSISKGSENELKEKLKTKDEMIKKLNNSVRNLCADIEGKQKDIQDLKADVKKKTEQLKVLVKQASELKVKTLATQEEVLITPSSSGNNISRSETPPTSGKIPMSDEAVTEITRLKTELAQLKLKMEMSKPETNAPEAPVEGEGEEEEEQIVSICEAQHFLSESEKRAAFSKLFAVGDDMSIVDLVGKSIPSGSEAEDAAQDLVNLYTYQRAHLEVMEHLIKAETMRTKSMNTLFRGEDLAARVLRVFIHVTGAEYANYLLHDLLEEVATQNYNYEIDHNRADPSTDIAGNLGKLRDLCQRFFDRIIHSVAHVPPEFLRLTKCLCDNSVKRFGPGSEQLATAGFIFLRFICPAVTTPHIFRLPEIPGDAGKRTLLLVGKILQNLANGVEFKEDYLADMNQFLVVNEKPLAEFFTKLRVYPPTIDGDSDYIVDLVKSVYPVKEKLKGLIPTFQLEDNMYNMLITLKLSDRVSRCTSAIVAAGDDWINKTMLPESFGRVVTDNEEFLGGIITVLAVENNPVQRKNVAEWLVHIYQTLDKVPLLASATIQNEIAQTTYQYLHDSFTKSAFMQYCTSYAGSWIRSLLSEIVTNVATQNLYFEIDQSRVTDEMKFSFNRDENANKLAKLADVIMDTILSGLSSCPTAFWTFANLLALNTDQNVFQFCIINFFALAIENPFNYGILNEKPRKEAHRTFQLLSDVARAYANDSQWVVDSLVPLDTALNAKYQEKFKSWSQVAPTYMSETKIPVAAEQHSTAVLELSKWIESKFATALQPVFEKTSTTMTVVYNIADLMDSFAHVERKPLKRTTTAGPKKLTPAPNPEVAKKEEKEKEKERKNKEKEDKKKQKEAEKELKKKDKK